jgi:Protein of unknown function (DUF1360)
MQYYWLILGILAVWRVTHLLSFEDGPANLLTKLRARLENGLLGNLIECFYCLSVWVALPFAFVVGESLQGQLLLWPALSAGAILLERTTAREVYSPPVIYHEDPEEKHVLRQK